MMLYQGWDGLTPLQADGLACVVCGLDYLRNATAHVPVGYSMATDSQVFVCIGPCEAVAALLGGEPQ
jgi:hypothetical protein